MIIQFVKTRTGNYGENRAAKKLGIEMIPMGEGFTWLSKDIEKDKATAREAWELARQRIYSDEYDLVVLDELTYPLTYGWIPVRKRSSMCCGSGRRACTSSSPVATLRRSSSTTPTW